MGSEPKKRGLAVWGGLVKTRSTKSRSLWLVLESLLVDGLMPLWRGAAINMPWCLAEEISVLHWYLEAGFLSLSLGDTLHQMGGVKDDILTFQKWQACACLKCQ